MGLDKQAIGHRIRVARIAANLSQEELADRSGQSVSAISLYETGKMMPSLHRAVTIADATGVTIGFLCGREGLESELAAGKSRD